MNLSDRPSGDDFRGLRVRVSQVGFLRKDSLGEDNGIKHLRYFYCAPPRESLEALSFVKESASKRLIKDREDRPNMSNPC
jgi:hypothetical protein